MQTLAAREAREGGMNTIRPRPALAAAKALLEAAQLPTSDLTDAHCDHFFYAGPESAPTGLVGLELFGDVALLRSLVVSPEARSSGVGSELVQFAETHAHSLGVSSVYLLTTTAEDFFLRRGYSKAERERAPPAIRTSREFAGLCPASSAFMSKQLPEGH
jgi:amino-acid N-acetyltransferase